MKQLLKHLYNRIKFRHLKPTIKCHKRWYGNKYGGFYLNPDLINKDSIVYSFGIGEDISFDMDMIYRHSCKVYGFDPTPKSIKWAKDYQGWIKHCVSDKFEFYESGLSTKTDMQWFFLPTNTDHVSGSLKRHSHVQGESILVPMNSFKDIKKILNHSKVNVVKMDIEGSEYDVMDSIEADQIAVELHERFFKDGKAKSIKLVSELKQRGYEIFAVSKSFEEVSFIKI